MKKKLQLKKHGLYILNSFIIAFILFSINETVSNYNTKANISTTNAIPILNIEAHTPSKEIQFIDYGWATHSFDVINGKIGSDGLFHVNEVDMEYYINAVKDSGDLSLSLKGLYYLNDDGSLGESIPFVEGKGYGPIDLPYKKDDEVVLNPSGYYESKYIKRVHYLLVYTYETCEVGSTNCIIDANEAGKDYKFHIEAKAYQKVS